MKVSKKGLDLIKYFESLALKKYKCPAGLPTIGYGHVILPGESLECITEAQADDLLARDCEIAEKCINDLNVRLTQNQFDALVSFVFNVGVGNFKISTIKKMLLSGNFDGAAMQFQKWVFVKGVKSNGLANRRRKEARMFTGVA